jgi:DNA-binding transcriptional regulator YdaS (Cro superfamily)
VEQNNETNLTGIADAVLRAGSQTELAAKIGVSQQVVSKWLKRGFVPLARVVEIESEYGIPRARLANPRLTSLVDSGVE